jgi:flagellar hook-basal body complex protein FliE
MAGATVATRTAHVPDRPMNEDDTHLVALPISKAAAALQLSTEGVRARIRRGQYEVRTGNDGRKLVLVPGSHLEQEHGTDDERPDTRFADVLKTEIDRLVTERDQARTDVERWRTQAEEARLVAARAEAERDGLRSERDTLRTELERARQPWWRRLLQ